MFLLASMEVVAASLKWMHIKARCEVHLLLENLPRSELRALPPLLPPSPMLVEAPS